MYFLFLFASSMFSAFRSLVSASLALGAMMIATPAFAATLTIEQRSEVASFGTWLLVPPSGNDFRSNSREERRTLNNLPAGIYTLQMESPEGATTTMRLLENGVIRESITGERLQFSLDATDTAHIQIVYTYVGTITVESAPMGAAFELSGPSATRFTGATPATFRHLPPGYYSVNFSLRSGCSVPRPIRRDLEANEQVTFLGEYRCGSASSARSSASSQRSAVARSNSSAHAAVSARVIHTLSQKETLPGSTVRVTVGIVNTSNTTIEKLMLTEQFDPAVAAIESLPSGAYLQGNTIIWRIPAVYAGQRWSDNVVLHVSSDADPGTTTLTARLSGDDLSGIPSGQLMNGMTLGIATLPATGGAYDAILALLGLLAPAPTLIGLRRRTSSLR